jgi:hypothetical protein
MGFAGDENYMDGMSSPDENPESFLIVIPLDCEYDLATD